MDSYAARALVDGRGNQLGLVAVLHRGALPDRETTETLLQIFAVRAAAEIERNRAQRACETSEESYRAIFDAAEDAIFVHDWDSGAILDVSAKATELYGYAREELLRLRVARPEPRPAALHGARGRGDDPARQGARPAAALRLARAPPRRPPDVARGHAQARR